MTRASRVHKVLARVAGLALIGVLAASTTAWAQPDDPTAETLDQWGMDFRVEYDWDDPKAMAAYQRVQKAKPSVRFSAIGAMLPRCMRPKAIEA